MKANEQKCLMIKKVFAKQMSYAQILREFQLKFFHPNPLAHNLMIWFGSKMGLAAAQLTWLLTFLTEYLEIYVSAEE